MRLTLALQKLAGEAARALRNFKYDITDSGIYLPHARATIGGVFRHAFAPMGGEFEPWVVDPNRMVTQGLVYALNAAFGGQAQTTSFFLAPFSDNATPAANWTGANFAANAGEFTDYTLATRLPWTVVPATTTAAVGNSAALPAATATFNAGGPYTLYGIGLLEASGKEAVTGKLAAATRFATPRTGMVGGDRLAFEYVITAIDEGDVP